MSYFRMTEALALSLVSPQEAVHCADIQYVAL